MSRKYLKLGHYSLLPHTWQFDIIVSVIMIARLKKKQIKYMSNITTAMLFCGLNPSLSCVRKLNVVT
jgi:hypothetical protein